jgi:hypothetical protein
MVVAFIEPLLSLIQILRLRLRMTENEGMTLRFPKAGFAVMLNEVKHLSFYFLPTPSPLQGGD